MTLTSVLDFARISHPNAEILEDHLVPLEDGATDALAFNSGMAAIVSALLQRLGPGEQAPVLIDVPRGSSIESWLIGEGFEVTRRLTRMVRGYAQPGNPQLSFAIAGFEYG